MNFLHPEFLYLLFIIPVLIAFNLFFKGKRTLPVTTLFIWEKFHEECKSSNISFNRFWRKPSLPGGIRIYLFPQFIKDDKAIVFVVMSAMSMVKVLMLLRYNFNKGK